MKLLRKLSQKFTVPDNIRREDLKLLSKGAKNVAQNHNVLFFAKKVALKLVLEALPRF